MMTDFEQECCVYWIRRKSHTDVLSQGYVGISSNFEYRLSQHINNCQNPKQYKNYRVDFRDAVSSGDYVASILVIGTRQYCLETEEKLRPDWTIGWNIAKGGSGGFGKHGLTGTQEYKTYYNLLTRAKQGGEIVCEEWVAPDGFLNFVAFLKEIGDDGELSFLQKGCGCNPSNVVRMPRDTIITRSYQRYDIGDGRLYAVKELAKLFNIKANTISCRLRDGWTIREAVGLDERPFSVVILKSGKCARYSGKLSVDQLSRLEVLYNSPVTLQKLGEEFDCTGNHIGYIAKMFGFSSENRVNRVVDFTGNPREFGLNSYITQELVDEVKKYNHKNITNKELAEILKISERQLSHLKTELNWSDYKKSLGSVSSHLENA